MKKLLGIMVLSLLLSGVASLAAVTNGDLTTNWRFFKEQNKIAIDAYNGNSSKPLMITEMQIWFKDCYNGIENSRPDRLYNINQRVNPRSDRRITIPANFTMTGTEGCSVFSHRMIEPKKIKKKSVTDSVGETLEKVNPLKYLEKRQRAKRECTERSSSADNSFTAKLRYKNCMKEYGF